MDSKYLKESVGAALSKGLSAVAVEQPDDPVEYLGNYLLNFVAIEERLQREKEEAAKMEEEMKAFSLEMEEKSRAIKAKEADKAIAAKAEDDFTKALEATEDIMATLAEGLETLKQSSGAMSCYIARKETVDDGEGGEGAEQLQYILASSGQDFMVGQTLKGSEDAVTFGLYTEEDGPEDEEGNPTKVFPTHVHVQNVVREEKIQFFGVPKIGAYLACPIKFKSYLHEGAVGPVNEETGETEKISKEAQYVLCLDTMGFGGGLPFGGKAVENAIGWANKMAAAYEAYELKLLEAEIASQKKNAESNTEMLAKLAEEKEAADAKLAEELAKLADLPEEEKALKAQQAKLAAAQAALLAMKEKITEIGRYMIEPKTDAIKVLQALLYMLGYNKKQLFDMGSKKVDWKMKMRKNFGSTLFDKIQAFDVEAKVTRQPYQKIGSLEKLIDGLSADALNQMSVAYGAVFEWVSAAVATRKIIVEQRNAAAAAEGAAEQED